MSGPPPATAAVRRAVRQAIADLPSDAVVAVAVSGGTDSLALAAALAFERPGSAAFVVDHQLQPGSAQVAARAAEQCRQLGLTAEVLRPTAFLSFPQHPDAVDTTKRADQPPADRSPADHSPAGHPPADQPPADHPPAGHPPTDHPPADHPPTDRSPAGHPLGTPTAGGPEARARELRYRLLDAAAEQADGTVLLGHTLDDQAETVLLGLARGAGARALSGMPSRRGRYRRPLLQLRRSVTIRACAEAGLEPWNDPHNNDPSYARVRARQVLPLLEQALGPGMAAALARTAGQLREDADALDALAQATGDVPRLLAMAPAVRARSLKRWAEEHGERALAAVHVQALRALVEDWHGQGPVGLPGGGSVAREEAREEAREGAREEAREGAREGARLVHRPPG